MRLHPNLSPRALRPKIPDALAHKANDTSIRTFDVIESAEALRNWVRDEIYHPVNRKLMEASRSRKIIIYMGLAILFLVILCIEYSISWEIYAVLFPMSPFLFFVLCVGIAFQASISLGETSSHFCLLSLDERTPNHENHYIQQATRELYDMRKKRTIRSRWYIHPVTGLIFTVVILSAIYIASQQRVAYLQAAGELSDGSFHVYIPVILYIFEIVLGVPSFFVLMWLHSLFRNRKLRKNLVKYRSYEIALRREAIRNYAEYLAQLERYNNWATQNNELQRVPISPCRELRQLLTDDLGYDPTNEDNQSSDEDAPIVFPPNDDVPFNSASNAEMNDAETEHENPEDDRVQDLLNLVDERIDHQNQGL